MPLDHAKLNCVRQHGERFRARCPACAENGGDRRGNHLSIDATGRFGCAAYPANTDHRRRIWALAGDGTQMPRRKFLPQKVVLRRSWELSDASDGRIPVKADNGQEFGPLPDVSDAALEIFGEYTGKRSITFYPDVSDGTFRIHPVRRPMEAEITDVSDGTLKPSGVWEKCCSDQNVLSHASDTSEKVLGYCDTKFAITSAAVALVPIDAPFIEGCLYREAGATEVRNRLDLYISHPTGPWVRRHGVLFANRQTVSSPKLPE